MLFNLAEDKEISEAPEIKTKRSGIDESNDHFATIKSKASGLDRSRADTEYQGNLFNNLIGETRNMIKEINEKEEKVQNVLDKAPVIDASPVPQLKDSSPIQVPDNEYAS